MAWHCSAKADLRVGGRLSAVRGVVANESPREIDGWGSGAGTQDFYRSTDWIRMAIEILTGYALPWIPYGVTVQPLEGSLWGFHYAKLPWELYRRICYRRGFLPRSLFTHLLDLYRAGNSIALLIQSFDRSLFTRLMVAIRRSLLQIGCVIQR